MKKFIIVCLMSVAFYLLWDYMYYHQSISITWFDREVTSQVKQEGKEIYLSEDGEYKPFEIKGVNMGAGLPGYFSTDYAITKNDYLRWFGYIQEMGANTVRVYTILSDDFYEAVYEYNKNNPTPLYFIHGLWVNDYIQNSHRDAYDSDFIDTFIEDGKNLIDIIHGKKKLSLGSGLGSGTYKKDISPWVIGYILGVEWEDVTVAYTDHMQKDKNNYQGRYFYTTPEATPFEAMLAQVGDQLVEYESKRYGEQRLVAFSNWPTTDPLEYSEFIEEHFKKIAKVDMEHIKLTSEMIAGTFASYHIYPYYPDYLGYEEDLSQYVDETGKINTYRAYLEQINAHHTIPVVISEFGVPSSRGMAQYDRYTARNQGNMSEQDQAEALVSCYEDIKAAGCAGAIIFSWQDEWFKRTWNTMHAVDLNKTPYWSDYQTNEQYFGILSFDPGEEESICYVDGDLSDWQEEDVILKNEAFTLSAKYDEKFIYLLAYQKDFKENERLYIPINTTQKTGSRNCDYGDISFNEDVDFVIVIDGKNESRVLVQERYEVLRAMFYEDTHGMNAYENPPDKATSVFKPINMILQYVSKFDENREVDLKQKSEIYETGLLTYGNANPAADDYNSLADFCFSGDYIEIKIPWQLLNFSNPSEMKIHDDYYENYGVEEIKINEMSLGIGTGEEEIQLETFELEGWGTKVTYHERLKPAYYVMQELWNSGEEEAP